MEQREFTREDYKGLNFIEKFGKKLKRNKIAKKLNKRRNQINYERDIDFIHLGDKGAENLANFKRRSALNHAMLDKSSSTAKVLEGDLKKAGMIGAGVAGTAALAYGAKKLYDKSKNKDMKEQKEFAENLPMETPKVSKEKASKLRDMFNRAKENIKNSKVGKNASEFYAKHEKGVKIGGGVAAGTALAAGLAVGAKKLTDKKEQQKEFARADYADLDFIGKKRLREERDEIARKLNLERNGINKILEDKVAALKNRGASESSIKHAKTVANLDRFESIADASTKAWQKRRDEFSKSILRKNATNESIFRHEKIARNLRLKKAIGKYLKGR